MAGRSREPGQHTAYTEGIPDAAIATMRELWNGKEKAERMFFSAEQVPGRAGVRRP